MSSWANESGTLSYKDIALGKLDTKNKDNLCGINHYHSIIAGMPICNVDDTDEDDADDEDGEMVEDSSDESDASDSGSDDVTED